MSILLVLFVFNTYKFRLKNRRRVFTKSKNKFQLSMKRKIFRKRSSFLHRKNVP